MTTPPGIVAELTVNSTGSDGSDAPSVLVEMLIRWPDMRARLLAEHTDDGNGRCRGCTVPGYGTPGGRWPCVLAVVAMVAEMRVDAVPSASVPIRLGGEGGAR
jgi:hypothetical protein